MLFTEEGIWGTGGDGEGVKEEGQCGTRSGTRTRESSRGMTVWWGKINGPLTQENRVMY